MHALLHASSPLAWPSEHLDRLEPLEPANLTGRALRLRERLPRRSAERETWSVDRLNDLFMKGHPSNDLQEAGLVVHIFDGHGIKWDSVRYGPSNPHGP